MFPQQPRHVSFPPVACELLSAPRPSPSPVPAILLVSAFYLRFLSDAFVLLGQCKMHLGWRRGCKTGQGPTCPPAQGWLAPAQQFTQAGSEAPRSAREIPAPGRNWKAVALAFSARRGPLLLLKQNIRDGSGDRVVGVAVPLPSCPEVGRGISLRCSVGRLLSRVLYRVRGSGRSGATLAAGSQVVPRSIWGQSTVCLGSAPRPRSWHP